ncbi:MAG: hypothetical protein JWL77_5161 [Chthonomonadaceae bacterium]|nr:hypothetical protein [Chthonomonadaceae bacterium]
MHIIIDLTPEEEARLRAIAVREGQDTATAATSLLRHALRQENSEDLLQNAPETESAYEALKDFIGKFDSREVRQEDKVPPSTDPHERAYGEIIAEKYRKQGFKV